MFNTVNEGIAWIESQIRFRPKTSLDPMRRAFELMSLSLTNIKKIHVTGTNGKGSVCMYLTSILLHQGLKVGTYTSPYLVMFNERIMLNGHPIDDLTLLKSINEVYELSVLYQETYQETLSFFELMTLMAMNYFHDNEVDVMIMEVGIGGLLDATNILNYDVSLITNVGMDHMKQLGNTLESIAGNKLGILKTGNHLITTIQPELYEQVRKHANQVGATFEIIDTNQIKTLSEIPHTIEYQNEAYHLSLLGHYQKDNAVLALKAAQYLYPKMDLKMVKEAFGKTNHPGRLEYISNHIMIDGAHNTHAIDALIESLQTTFKKYHVHVLFASLADKEPEAMIKRLKPYVTSIVTTAFPDPRYVNLSTLGFTHFNDPKEALMYMIGNKGDDDIILITGSLHFIGYMKKEILPQL